MPPASPVQWTEGPSPRLWQIGFLGASLGPLAVGFAVAWWLGVFPRATNTLWTAGLGIGTAAAIMLPVLAAYLWFLPTPARIAVIEGGILVELGDPKLPQFWVRQGYRWRDLRLSGTRLLLPPRGRAPRSLRLARAQRRQLEPMLAAPSGSTSR